MAKGKPVLPEGHRGHRRSRVRVLSWHDTSEGQRAFQAQEEKLRQYEKLLSDCLGALHIIQADARRIERFHDDPNLDVEEEARKIMARRLDMHREIVWAKNHGPDDWVCGGHEGLRGEKVTCECPPSVQNKINGAMGDA